MRRGYLMLEALVAGVVLATTLGWVLFTVGEASRNTSIATKNTVAANLVNQRAQQVLARGFAVVAADFPASPETIVLGGATYTRTMTVGAATSQTWNTTETVNVKDVSITSTYTTRDGAVISKTSSVQVFEPAP